MSVYIPLLFSVLVALCFALFLLGLGFFMGPKKPSLAKSQPFECGFPSLAKPSMPFDIRFYLVGILFILFDIETTLLYPWAVSLRGLDAISFWGMMFFLTVLFVGFFYEWSKGALNWE